MVKSVKVINFRNESIEFELTQPEKTGFYIRNITGLGPPLAAINTTEMATSDGAQYNSARVSARNIVVTLGFLMKPTIEHVRHLSYKYFSIKQKLKLIIKTDDRVGEIEGYVESNEPEIFSEQQTSQISIICPDPYFYSQKINTTLFSGVVPMFEFPFSNESLTENLIVMGEMRNEQTRTIDYEGDAEVGVTIYIYVFGSVSDITIFDPISARQMVISAQRLESLTGSSLIEGDMLIITTVKGIKSIKLLRAGIEYNVLNALNRDAYWFQLVKGDNIFSYTSEFGLSNLNFRIENKIVYEGM